MERNGAGAGFGGYTKNTKSQQITTSEMKQKETGNTSTVHDIECTVREQDRFMPIANVIRLMRKIIPPHAKISDDAKETIQECVSEFISFVTSEANVHCQQEMRKTITAEDVLWAMSNLGFDDYVEPLAVFINRYRESEAGGERGSLRGEAFVKRSADAAGMPIAPGFPPGYFMGPNTGFLGAMAMGGFLKDARNAGPSSARNAGPSSARNAGPSSARNAGPSSAAAVNTPEPPFAKCKK